MPTNINKFTYFVMLNPHQAYLGFPAHFVDGDGMEHFIMEKKNGEDVYKHYFFTKKNRAIRIANHKKDEIEFLRNHPSCYGSPNLVGEPEFKEMNDERDALSALEAKKYRMKAEQAAIKLEGEELAEVALLLGCTKEGEGLQSHYVIETAGNDPAFFFEIANDPARSARYIVRKGLDSGVLKKKGFIIMWGELPLGNDEDGAAARLMKEKKISEGITTAIKKAGY